MIQVEKFEPVSVLVEDLIDRPDSRIVLAVLAIAALCVCEGIIGALTYAKNSGGFKTRAALAGLVLCGLGSLIILKSFGLLQDSVHEGGDEILRTDLRGLVSEEQVLAIVKNKDPIRVSEDFVLFFLEDRLHLVQVGESK